VSSAAGVVEGCVYTRGRSPRPLSVLPCHRGRDQREELDRPTNPNNYLGRLDFDGCSFGALPRFHVVKTSPASRALAFRSEVQWLGAFSFFG